MGQWNAMRQAFGHYDGANAGRLQGDWPTTYDTAYWNLRGDRTALIARTQKMVDNNPTARAILETIVSDVIGTGIRPKARVKFETGEPIVGINKALDDGWDRYNDEWDSTGHATFYEAESMILREIITCGAVLTNKVSSPDGSMLGVSSQIVPVLRLDTSHDDDAPTYSDDPAVKQTVFGINIDERGAPVSYWIQGIAKPISARNMHQVFRRQRPEEFTGTPWFVPALKYLWANEQLTRDKLIASRIQAMIGMIMPDNMYNGLVDTRRNSDDHIAMQAGRIYRYDAALGGKPELLQPDDSIKDQLIPLQQLLLHAISVSLGWSYQTVTRDVTKINMAAGKINTNKDRQAARMIQRWFIKAHCQAEWNQFVYRMFLEGRVKGRSIADYLKDPWKYSQCQWQPAGWDYVDPAREIQGIVNLRENGLKTLQEFYSERGVDWMAAVDQLEAEEAYIASKPNLSKRLGPAAKQPPIPQQAPTGGVIDDDGDEEEDED